jgi:hypothetical protein
MLLNPTAILNIALDEKNSEQTISKYNEMILKDQTEL